MRLRLLTWNLSYFQGTGSEGKNYRRLPEVEFRTRLHRGSALIREWRPDLVFLQEVDFDSKRSYHHDQALELRERTALAHETRCESWNHPYVPFPFWPPSRHFGRIHSGGAILSRLAQESIQNTLLPKPPENGFLYNSFYLSRYLQEVRMEGVHFLNLHLEAFSESNRKEHLRILTEHLRDLAEKKIPTITGGDFNGVLLDAKNQPTFPLPKGYQILSPDTPTFPAAKPSETLDHFLLPAHAKVHEARVLPVDPAHEISDHLPFAAEIEL